VEELSKAGVATVASARREAPLNRLAEQYESVQALPMDISDAGSIQEKVTRAWDMHGGVDVLINNAGMSHRFLFAEADPDVLRRIVDVNLTGTMLVTRAVLPRMIAAGGGHIVAVTSMVVRIPTPQRSAYAASKNALHGLFDCIRAEVAASGVCVSLVVPGLVNTEISESAATGSGERYGIKDRNQANGMSSEQCARRILRGIAGRRREISVARNGLTHFGTFMRRFMPAIYFRLISRVKVHGK
jgi:short-subunit dehydrogenase